MNTDHWDDLKAAGDVRPPSPEVLAHARRQLDAAAATSRRTHRRRLVVSVLAAAGTAAVVVGAVAIHQTGSTPVPATGPSATPTRVGGTPSTSRPLEQGAASCVVGYSPAELRNRGFAFDGTVLSAVKDPRTGALETYTVTFQVHEWFRPTGGDQVKIRMWMAPAAGSDDPTNELGQRYWIGSRLLISGESLSGSSEPLKDPIAWGCGFSRTYDARTAATWRKALSK